MAACFVRAGNYLINVEEVQDVFVGFGKLHGRPLGPDEPHAMTSSPDGSESSVRLTANSCWRALNRSVLLHRSRPPATSRPRRD